MVLAAEIAESHPRVPNSYSLFVCTLHAMEGKLLKPEWVRAIENKEIKKLKAILAKASCCGNGLLVSYDSWPCARRL